MSSIDPGELIKSVDNIFTKSSSLCLCISSEF